MPHAGLDASRASTGVVWCTERAIEYGFFDEPEAWANLGQGAPEVEDDIAGCFQRPKSIEISLAGREYAPTAGIKPLREAVANLYNTMHRQGKASQYTWENVAIVSGGRAGLIRIAAVLGNSYLSFFLPDYTAYNEMLSLFKNVSALSFSFVIPFPLSFSFLSFVPLSSLSPFSKSNHPFHPSRVWHERSVESCTSRLSSRYRPGIILL